MRAIGFFVDCNGFYSFLKIPFFMRRNTQMNDNKLILSGVCPYCPAVLDYAEDAKAVTCHSCGNVVPTRILRPLDFAKHEQRVNEDDRRIADAVTSSGAGIIYFDNFCNDYDWRGFALTSALSIPTLDAIAEACKLKFSADPITYLLHFRCVAIPVTKKIEGLDVLEVEIIDNYKSDDLSDLFEYVDLYSTITHAIVEKRDALIRALANDVMLAKRFGVDPHIAADLDRSFAAFVERINAVKAVSGIEDVPGYQKAKDLKDAQLAADIRKIGIDAEKTYRKALALLNHGNVDNALHLFCAIHGYKDSDTYINDNSMIFKFNDELAAMAGKFYVVRRDASYTFDAENPSAATSGTMSLYEISGGVPSGSPTLTMVSDIIHSFGSRIFFIRNDVSICCYDTKSTDYSANVKILDESPTGDYVNRHPNPVYYSSDKTKFFIRKKLREETVKPGCFGRRKKKKSTINRDNNYAIVLVDMDNVTSKVILPEVVDIMDYYDDKIFYTTVEHGCQFPSFRVYDIATEKSTEILNSNCLIHDVKDGKIIYSLRVPSIYNMDMYSIDIKTEEHNLIDENISSYHITHGNKVFYEVGTEDDKRLYSANFDGTDRREIMERPGRICKYSSGWLYYVNGEGTNACLMKVSVDGEKNMLVASRFAKLVKMLNGYIYYLSTKGELKVVRSDGSGDTKIAAGVDDISRIIIDNEKIYYLKRDYLGPKDGGEDGFGYSLYTTDLTGKNLHKLAHDVSAMAEYNDRYIYLCKNRDTKYSVKTPLNRKDTRTEVISRDLTYYEAYDRVLCKFTEIVHFGVPTRSFVSYKKSFWPFSKYVTDQSVISEIHPDYVRENIAPVGMVRNEELEKMRRAIARLEAEKQEKRDAKRAKKEAKRAKKDAKKAEKAKARETEHEHNIEDIDTFIEENEKFKAEEEARLEEKKQSKRKKDRAADDVGAASDSVEE